MTPLDTLITGLRMRVMPQPQTQAPQVAPIAQQTFAPYTADLPAVTPQTQPQSQQQGQQPDILSFLATLSQFGGRR